MNRSKENMKTRKSKAKYNSRKIYFFMALSVLLLGTAARVITKEPDDTAMTVISETVTDPEQNNPGTDENDQDSSDTYGNEDVQNDNGNESGNEGVRSDSEADIQYLASLEYSGQPYVIINDNIPYFDEVSTEEFEIYSDLDETGRCGEAFVNVSPSTLPSEERESIANVKPTAWHTYNTKSMFDQVLADGTFYVYNRCHLVAFCLAGENANPKNLITGTRYMNVNMIEFEEEVLDYVEETGNHVYYRVTPVYDGEDLLAKGVLMEAQSVETDDIEFCVYLFNVQMLKDGTILDIDYSSGTVIE